MLAARKGRRRGPLAAAFRLASRVLAAPASLSSLSTSVSPAAPASHGAAPTRLGLGEGRQAGRTESSRAAPLRDVQRRCKPLSAAAERRGAALRTTQRPDALRSPRGCLPVVRLRFARHARHADGAGAPWPPASRAASLAPPLPPRPKAEARTAYAKSQLPAGLFFRGGTTLRAPRSTRRRRWGALALFAGALAAFRSPPPWDACRHLLKKKPEKLRKKKPENLS